MNLLPSGQSLSFEVTYDAGGLNVAMSIYDLSGFPTLVSGPTAMDNVVGNTYVGAFTPSPMKKYLVSKAVYTDNTFTTFHPDYSQSSETFLTESFSSDIQPDLDGTIDDAPGDIQGELNDVDDSLSGVIDI